MNITIQCIHCKVRKTLQDRLRGKLDKLESKYNWIVGGTIYFTVKKNDHRMNKVVELLLTIPRHEIFAKGQEETFELAANKAMDGISQQLKKLKERELSHLGSKPFTALQ